MKLVVYSIIIACGLIIGSNIQQALQPKPNFILEITKARNSFSTVFNVAVKTPIVVVDRIPNGGAAIGMCYYGTLSTKIELLASYVKSASPEAIEALVWHELAHCELGFMGHVKDQKHIMASSAPWPGTEDRAAYIDQIWDIKLGLTKPEITKTH